MLKFEFVVMGPAQPKLRHRTAQRSVKGITRTVAYTPKKTVEYEALVGASARRAMPPGASPSANPVSLAVTIKVEIPASWPRQKRADAAAGIIRPTSKPDASNVLKSIEDGLNGIAYYDDSQVCSVVLLKRYAEVPSVVVQVVELDQRPSLDHHPKALQASPAPARIGKASPPLTGAFRIAKRSARKLPARARIKAAA